jgi:hypothetical protein
MCLLRGAGAHRDGFDLQRNQRFRQHAAARRHRSALRAVRVAYLRIDAKNNKYASFLKKQKNFFAKLSLEKKAHKKEAPCGPLFV